MKGSNPAPPKGPKPKPPRNPPSPTEGGMIEQPRTFEDWVRRRRERKDKHINVHGRTSRIAAPVTNEETQ